MDGGLGGKTEGRADGKTDMGRRTDTRMDELKGGPMEARNADRWKRGTTDLWAKDDGLRTYMNTLYLA